MDKVLVLVRVTVWRTRGSAPVIYEGVRIPRAQLLFGRQRSIVGRDLFTETLQLQRADDPADLHLVNVYRNQSERDACARHFNVENDDDGRLEIENETKD
ncbi:MAG TPA: hypothetical protein VE967_12925 [Gemmatimonadaceae bacterium]|nr:hypothetical protein [Gemmatimonadaceae bacterium]